MAKPGNTTPPTRPTPGIRSRGGAIAFATGAGLLAALLGSALSLVYLEHGWAPRSEAALAQRVAQSLAEREAERLQLYLAGLHARLAAVAAGPAVQQAIEANGSAPREALEEDLASLFPGATSLRVLPLGVLGTAGFTRGDLELRSHIEVDLVRRAAQDEAGAQESFEHEGHWLTSMATPVPRAENDPRRAVILLTLDNTELAAQLRLPPGAGTAVLEQLYRDSKGREHQQAIASTGDTAAQGSAFVSYAPVEASSWRVAFTPGEQLLASLAIDRRGLYTAAAVGALGALGGVLLTASLYRRRLRRESAQLLAQASTRQPLTFSVPELAPIARQLRGDGSGPRPLQGDTPSGDGAHGNGPLPAAADAPAPTPAETPSARDLDEPLLELDLDLAEDAAQNPAGESAFPDHIFRAYDIRGNAERELNDALVRGIGQVVAELLQERGEQQLVVGSDGRLSSPRIRSQLISALLECGLEVIDIGTVPTPLLHFALHRLDCPSGVMVTGSHNPAEDNGLKIVLDRQTLADGAIQEIRERVLAAGAPVAGYTRGRVRREDVIGTYIAELAGDIAIAMPVKVVIDAGNGTTGLVAPQLFDELGCEVVPLFCEVDGHFPNHSPDTSDEANLAALCSAVRAEGADLGLAFDGDGDRVAVVTGSGKIVRTDRLMMLLAEDVVSRNPGADVVFDVKCSRNLARLVTQLGGRPVLWKTGHAFMKQKVAETGALLGGEFSGHIFFTERWYGHDDGMYAAARLVEILSALDRSLDEALSAFPDPVSTPEIRIPVPERDKFALIGKIAREAVFDGGKINTLDGIRVDFDSGWGLLRASNTSAALTARFEADSEEQLAAIQQAFRDQVGRIAPQLSLPF